MLYHQHHYIMNIKNRRQALSCRRKENTMEEKKIDRLYELLERAEKERDTESAVALRWAIFTLEQAVG